MNRTLRHLAVPAAFVVLLAGCGEVGDEPVAAPSIEAEVESSDGGGEPTEAVAAPEMGAEDDESPANEITGPGVYRANTWFGGVATAAVPAQPVEDIEAFREATGTDPVGYIVVEIDNTDGDEAGLLWQIRVVDSKGDTYVYEEVSTAIYEWAGDDYSLIDQELALTEKYPYNVDPTAKATIPMIGPEVPEDIVSVIIEDTRAEKVGDL